MSLTDLIEGMNEEACGPKIEKVLETNFCPVKSQKKVTDAIKKEEMAFVSLLR